MAEALHGEQRHLPSEISRVDLTVSAALAFARRRSCRKTRAIAAYRRSRRARFSLARLDPLTERLEIDLGFPRMMAMDGSGNVYVGVVDDDESLRRSLARLLRAAGMLPIT